MDGGGRVLAAAFPVLLGGQHVLVHPLTLGGISAAENYLLIQRGNPVDAVLSAVEGRQLSVPEVEVWTRLHERASSDLRRYPSLSYCTIAQINDWLDQPEGMAFSGWWCCGRGVDADPRFGDVGQARRFFHGHREEVALFRRARNLVSGTDLLSSMDWPEQLAVNPDTGNPIRPVSSGRINWQELLHFFAESFGWGPEQVAALTLYQFRLYTSERGEWGRKGGGTRKISAEDAKKMAGMNPTQKRQFLRSLGVG